MSDDPIVELRPWEARKGVPVRTVWVPVDGKPEAVRIRIKAGVKRGARLRLPGGQHLRVRVTIQPLVYRVLAATLVCAGLIAAVFPSTLMLGTAWALLEFCRSRRDRKTGLRRQLCVFGVLYLVPMGLALAFHVALGAVLAARRDWMSADSLLALEATLANASKFFSETLKLSELEVLGVLVLLYLVTALVANALVSKVLHGATEFYSKFSGPVAAGLAVLTAFTFFGTHLATQAQVLDQHIRTTKLEHDEVSRDAERYLASKVASDLAEKIRAEMPPDYQNVLVAQLVRFTSPSVNTDGDQPRRPMPGSTTRDQVTTAREVVDRATTATATRPQGERKIALQVEKVLTEALMKLGEDTIKQVPMLEPVMQALMEAVDRHLQDGVLTKTYDRMMDALWRSPGDLDAIARELVDSVDITDIAAKVTPGAKRWAEFQRLLDDLDVDAKWETAGRTLLGMDLKAKEWSVLEKKMTPSGAAPTVIERRAAQVASHHVLADTSLRERAAKICGCRI